MTQNQNTLSDIKDKDAMKRVSVLLPVPLKGRCFDYLVQSNADIPLGSFVKVPFGKRELMGVVWRDVDKGDTFDRSKLKTGILIDHIDPMAFEQRDFIGWMSRYTMADLGMVLKLSLSSKEAFEPLKKIPVYSLNQSKSDVKITAKRQLVLTYLADTKQPVTSKKIAEDVDVSMAVIKSMAKAGLLTVTSRVQKFTSQDLSIKDAITLNDEQKIARDHCLSVFQEQSSSVTVIDGVTGSGKTETYLDLVRYILKQGQQVLILLPEIALTQQVVQRFEDQIGIKPVLWHSARTPSQRREAWRAVSSGDARVVIGARSALFLSYQNLGLTILDEEHDSTYKQEEGVFYNARDMAIIRASLSAKHKKASHVLLVSATPSLETLENVESGKYQLVTLRNRYGGATMPNIHVIDLRKDKPEKGHYIAPSLVEHLKSTFARKEQSLLFLNRRGYAPLTLCQSCGHRFECAQCSAWLVEHKRFYHLQCHQCGYTEQKPDSCPSCGSVDSLSACGPGVERLIEEVREHVPLAKFVVFSSDNMADPDILKNTLDQIRRSKFDILIGTQMLAKGHHFPNLTTVGIIDADSGLGGGDLRASEKTYQLLHQVSGRAGRAEKSGNVYIQTIQPHSKIIQAMIAGDREAFVQAELNARDDADMPPFTRLASIIIRGYEKNDVVNFSKEMARHIPKAEGVSFYGPAPAPIERLRNMYRYRFLIKAEKTINVQKVIDFWFSHFKIPKDMRVQIDIDPYSFN